MLFINKFSYRACLQYFDIVLGYGGSNLIQECSEYGIYTINFPIQGDMIDWSQAVHNMKIGYNFDIQDGNYVKDNIIGVINKWEINKENIKSKLMTLYSKYQNTT